MRALPRPVWAGILIAGIAAAVGSWAALSGLALATGWLWWSAHLLPASVDIAGISAGWVWLRAAVTPPARAYARRLTYGAAALSIAGNAVSHLVAENILDGDSWPLIVAVGAIPAVMLVALVHMAALLVEDPTAPQDPPSPEVHDVPQVRAAEAPAEPSAKPEPLPRTARRVVSKPAPVRGTRQAIVLDILAATSSPDDVPQPAEIRDRWGVSQATAERARADALTSLTTTHQEA